MSDVTVPPVPVWLAHRPTVGGLVVPWITPQAGDGRYLFAVLDPARQHAALIQRLCQVCGRPLGRRLVLLMRAQDLPRRCTAEPGCDPQMLRLRPGRLPDGGRPDEPLPIHP